MKALLASVVCCTLSCAGALAAEDKLTAEDRRCLAWFDTLGFPDLGKCKLVKAATGQLRPCADGQDAIESPLAARPPSSLRTGEATLLSKAANRLDQELMASADVVGESRPNARRVHFVSPLDVVYRVDEGERRVVVLHVWQFRTG